jgi:8-oxo-dGTP pyrophosphatase MutT (NUDIX family)
MDIDWDITPESIQRKLALAHEQSPDEEYLSAFLSDAPKPAAVLVPLLRAPVESGEVPVWHLLLTRRSDHLTEHRGQVAFPGGRSDPSDPTPEATALREAHEEIGLPTDQVQILGRLPNLWTITNYSVTPVVSLIPWPFSIRPATHEVSRVFTIPLYWLADPAHHEVRQREIPSPYSQQLKSDSYPIIYFHPYDGEVLWGVSAEITINLIHLLFK